MSYGSKPFGGSPFGGPLSLFNLLEVSAVNPFTMVLRFSENPDFGVPSVRDALNYVVRDPQGTLLSVTKVVEDPDPKCLRIITGSQSYTLYTVKVNGGVESALGSSINPLADTGTCTGYPEVGRLRVQAVQQQAIVVIFNQAMLVNLAFTDPASYLVQDPLGVQLPVTSVTSDYPSGATRAYIQLATPLVSGVSYSITIGESIVTEQGLQVLPVSSKVTWFNQKPRSTKITLSKFTGEVQAPAPTKDRSLSEVVRLEETLAVELAPYRVAPQVSGDTLRESLFLGESVTVLSNRFEETLHNLALIEQVYSSEFMTFGSDSRSTFELSLAETLTAKETLTLAPDLSNSPTQTVDSGIANLFGTPLGLVFFSPSLVPGGVSNSTIQVSNVSVCTQSFDSYKIPNTKAYRTPFYLFGLTGNVSVLNKTPLFDTVQPWDAQLNLHDTREEVVSPPVDVGAGVILKQKWDPTWAALLNNPGWVLSKDPLPTLGSMLPQDDHTSPSWVHFDSQSYPTYRFITADTLHAHSSGPQVNSYFESPEERMDIGEQISVAHTSAITLHAVVTQGEQFDLAPGETQVQLNVSETLVHSETASFRVGIINTEVVHLVESISITS